jgi:hypothetical protein
MVGLNCEGMAVGAAQALVRFGTMKACSAISDLNAGGPRYFYLKSLQRNFNGFMSLSLTVHYC